MCSEAYPPLVRVSSSLRAGLGCFEASKSSWFFFANQLYPCHAGHFQSHVKNVPAALSWPLWKCYGTVDALIIIGKCFSALESRVPNIEASN